ncbi:hypothetical protein [Maribacter luteus]|uniref:hypothetical protein n=1 Tax=Maribacter luteus TaxID=2594478 RepID=UPI0024908567|nr:hypothetical protein [Maribacter luteus]
MGVGTYRIMDKDFWYQIERDFPTGGGTYELFCKDENQDIIPVNRLLGKDTNGVLYIGKAKNFLDRVITLKKSISPDYISENHECGTRYKLSDGIKKSFPYEGLHVKLTYSQHERELELVKFNEYLGKFGEYPPLNRIG